MSGSLAHDGARPGPVVETRRAPLEVTVPSVQVVEPTPVVAGPTDLAHGRAQVAATPGAPPAGASGGAVPTGFGRGTSTAFNARQMLALQRSVGNRAVSSVMGGVTQRVAIKEATKTETLYNKKNAQGQATANSYTMKPKYEMTRSGDTGVTVQVKIKFLSQTRNGVDPAAPGSPAGTLALGTLIGSPTEI
ncbi:MAG: hypothetical protein LH650_14165, partial [Chloroflexi bacterium]|nr:hypothetical protein [Chloroflexota bacterium]